MLGNIVLQVHRSMEYAQNVDLVRPTLKIDDAVVTPQEYPHVAAGRGPMDVTDLRELSKDLSTPV